MKVTVNKIAELSQVSRGTVDRVIHGRPGVSEAVRKNIEKIIKELNYTPNLAGKALVSQNKNIRFCVVLAPDFHSFVDEIKKGILSEAEQIKAFGVEVDIEVIKTLDAKEQLEILDRLEKANVSGITIVPIVQDVITTRLNEISKRGIPVVTFNSDLKNSDRISFVGQNNEKAGRTAYGLMENILPGGSQIAVITSSKELTCHRGRLIGFQSGLAKSISKLKVVAINENLDQDDLSFKIVKDICKCFPDLKGIYLTGGGSYGLGKALKNCGMEKQVKVITHDLVPPVIDLMKEGIVKFTIGQDPFLQGMLPIRILFDYVFKKKSPKNEIFYTGIDIRTIDNI